MARSPPRKRQTSQRSAAPAPAAAKPAAPRAAPKRKEAARDGDGSDDGAAEARRPAKRGRTAGAGAGAGAGAEMPLAERTAVSSMGRALYIGAHVSAAGGVHKAIDNARQIGANAFALFLKPQRKWASAPLAAEARDLFAAGCGEHGYSPARHVLPHGSYLVNLAQADEAKAAQAYGGFVDDLRRCEALGVGLYNLHPGAALGGARGDAVARIARQLNRAHAETAAVVTVLENMAGGGSVVGASWEDLRDIIALVDDKRRVGVCIDTCHAFAAGYDLRTPEAFRATMDAFDDIVGARYLKAMHLNDSKAPLGSRRDLHANIGTGFLGLRAFHSIVNDDRFRDMPLVLETPAEDGRVWADEIKLLEGLVGMDPDGDAFAARAAELQARGAAERARVQLQVDKRSGGRAKAGGRGGAAAGKKAQGRGGRRKKKSEDEDDDEEEAGESGDGSD